MRAVEVVKRLHCIVLHVYYYYTHARRRLNGSLEPLSPSLKLYTYVQNIYITMCNNKWAAAAAPVSCPPWQTTTAPHCIQASSHFPRSLVLVRTLAVCNNISKYHRRYTEWFTKLIIIINYQFIIFRRPFIRQLRIYVRWGHVYHHNNKIKYWLLIKRKICGRGEPLTYV